MITDETDDNRESYMPQIKTLLSNYNMKLLILHTEPVVRHHWNGSAWVPTNVFNYYQNLLDINNMNEMARTEIITPDSSNLSSAILSGLVSLSCSGEPIIGMCSNVVNAPEGQYSSFADLTNEQLCASGDVIEESKVNSDNRLSWVCRGYNGGDNSHECVYMKERPRAGVCGVAVQAPAGTYTSFGAIPADDLCGPGTAQLITENAANIIWRCNGIHGGANSPECVISKNYNATCGAARNITFNSLEDLQSDGRLCGANSTLEGSITDTATGWSWTCRPNTGLGNNANCSTTKTACPDGTILPQGVVPNDQTCPPTPECFMFVSGMFSGHENTDNYGRWTAVGDTEPRHVGGPAPLQIVSSFVGIGEYPASSPHTGYTGTTDYRSPNGYSVEEYPFLHADSFTFDSIALGSNTKVTIYSERNFQGTVITEIKGPALVNNVHLKTPLHDSYDWQNATLPAPYNDVIPPSARVWSTENMQPWGRGTSVKVICEPPPPACGDMSKENGDYYFAHQQVPDDKFCASGVAVSKANRRPQIEWKCQNPSDVTQQVDCSYDTPTVGVCGGFDLDATMEVCSAEWIAELEQMGLYASPGTLCANPEDTDPAVLESISRNPTNTDQYCNVGSLYNNAPNYGHSTQVLSNGVVHNIRMAQWVCHEPGVYGGDGRPYGWTCAFDTAPFLAKCKYKNSYNNFNTSNAECETGSVQNARSTSTSLDWECHSTAPGVTFHTNCGYNSSANVDPSTVGICNQSLTIYQSEIPSLTPTSKPWCAQGTVGNFSTSATRIDYECIGSNPAYKSTCWYSF